MLQSLLCKWLGKLDGYKRQEMVHWYNPPNSIRTGLESLLATLFGPFTDRREIQAALNPRLPGYRYDTADELWLDFVADLGDGWNSTYAIACLLAQREINFPHLPEPLRRGRVLIMGGDEVYPVAHEQTYRLRTERPYGWALPKEAPGQRPDLYAIPGNHDWYDGLTSFLRLFCQQREIGRWRTRQHRSYFALRLPHRWWLWAVDTQLQANLDRPQRDYFVAIAAGGREFLPERPDESPEIVTEDEEQGQPEDGLRQDDRVILCLPKPAWLYSNREVDRRMGFERMRGPHETLAFIEEEIIRPRGAVLALTLSGDWHHYCRYESISGQAHKITAGGGGAYMLGTHTLEDAVPVGEQGRQLAFVKATAYPDEKTSKKLLRRNFCFAWFNILFSWFIIGAFYLFHAWAIQGENLPRDAFHDILGPGTITFQEHVRTIPLSAWNPFSEGWIPTFPHAPDEIFYTYYITLAGTPAIILFALFLWLCLTLFCDPPESTYRWSRRAGLALMLLKASLGGVHAVAHVVVNLWLIWLFWRLNFVVLGPFLHYVQTAFHIMADAMGSIVAALLSWIPTWISMVMTWIGQVFIFLFGWLIAILRYVFGWIPWLVTSLFTFDPSPDSWWQRVVYTVEMITIGGTAAGTVFGIYLYLTNRLLWFHEDSSFSSLRIQDFKNFLRLHITPQGLTVYPIGLATVPRCWRVSYNRRGHWFEPTDRAIEPHLIEDPIHIPGPPDLSREREVGIGLCFRETLKGRFSIGEIDPVEGTDLAHSKMTLKVRVLIDNLDRFLCEANHTGRLDGNLTLAGIFDQPVAVKNGTVQLFAPYEETPRKLMKYSMTFRNGGQSYHLVGQKLVEDDPGFDMWKDTTTLETRLYEGIDETGNLVGAGILKVGVFGVIRNVLTMQAFNAKSTREAIQAVGVFLAFFAAELWDTYVERTKGYFIKFTIVSWAVLGTFYLLQSWALEAASYDLQRTFMQQLADIPSPGWWPWHWPHTIGAILRLYADVVSGTLGLLAFPLALLIVLNLCRRDDGVPTLLGLRNLHVCPGLWAKVHAVLHTGLHLLLTLVLIALFAKLNLVFFGLDALGFWHRFWFFVEMVFVGGTLAGLMYGAVRGVKVMRPYVGWI